MDVGHCADPGCYSRAVRYSNATMRQMNALADLSSECHQSIKVKSNWYFDYSLLNQSLYFSFHSQYDCNYAPFELNGVTFSWWTHRNGVARYFWAGSNASVHTCQCGIDHNCTESYTTCNCDSAVPIPLTDAGKLTFYFVLCNRNILFYRCLPYACVLFN